MTNYGRVRGSIEPQEVEISGDSVFVASNITPITETIDDHEVQFYEYDYIGYNKDEYIHKITRENADNINMLTECILEMSEIIYS